MSAEAASAARPQTVPGVRPAPAQTSEEELVRDLVFVFQVRIQVPVNFFPGFTEVKGTFSEDSYLCLLVLKTVSVVILFR